ncbi:peptidoglycan/xylan/chitin deacetylase (PgdA/CDA1 family) [Actinomadura pelletieri DSM 43383]|uniref:Peptidoglycan/xylan/chitin deacetylase (PgdA/CDA1 family) n=1 Tax=Actinomadura pelletieri DSM 43383 TaxID=1120940 RepID=A0A495QY14_9ACTN|nr:peptidoglycan/xylan/chitin deacetylase (PgdA/CDA1 family) [Actinomadura pelletieri DSM 43383]
MGGAAPSPPSRRRALFLMGAAALGLTGLAADDVRPGDRSPAPTEPTVRARPVIKPTPTPTPTPTPRPASWTPGQLTASETPVRYLTTLAPPPPPKSIALTIDDGPHPEWTPRVLDLLAEENVRATFFIIGEQVKEYPALTRRIADAGHQICNHTETHPIDIADLSTKRVRQEIVDAHDRIADTTGIVPRFFRSPGGAWSDTVLELTAEHGMLPIDWAVDPRDWARPGTGSIRRGLLECDDGDILLCHDGGGDRSQTVAALESVIPKLKKRGLTFVTL